MSFSPLRPSSNVYPGGSSQPLTSGQSQLYSGEGSGYGSVSAPYGSQSRTAAAAAGSPFGHSPMPVAYPPSVNGSLSSSLMSGTSFSGPSASVHLDVNGIKGVPTNVELNMSTGSSKADGKPAAKDSKVDGEKKAEGEEGAADPAAEASEAWYSKIKGKIWDVGGKISEFAHNHLSADNASLLLTILKVKPLVIALLLFPPGIAVTVFAIGVAITIIRPSIAEKNPTTFSMAARTIGLYSIFQGIKEAVLMGLSSTPQLHLVAVATYLFVTSVCFKLAENLSPIFKKKESDVKEAEGKAKANTTEEETGHTEAVKGLKMLGLASKAPGQAPERDDQSTSSGSGSGGGRVSSRGKGGSAAPGFLPQREAGASSPDDDFEHVSGSGAASSTPSARDPEASGYSTSARPAPYAPSFGSVGYSGSGSHQS